MFLGFYCGFRSHPNAGWLFAVICPSKEIKTLDLNVGCAKISPPES